MKTAFIGGGIMAEAMLSRAIAQGVLDATEVCVAEPVSDRRSYLEQHYNVGTSAQNIPPLHEVSTVILAVKPQQLPSVFDDIGGHLSDGQTIVSIVAGTGLRNLSAGLQHQRIVRVMPNTPAQVGMGVSVWTASPGVTSEARETTAALLRCLGTEMYVEDETLLDMATAVSGSGPAYVFKFIEALTDAAVALGLPQEMTHTMVLETVLGSAALGPE